MKEARATLANTVIVMVTEVLIALAMRNVILLGIETRIVTVKMAVTIVAIILALGSGIVIETTKKQQLY